MTSEKQKFLSKAIALTVASCLLSVSGCGTQPPSQPLEIPQYVPESKIAFSIRRYAERELKNVYQGANRHQVHIVMPIIRGSMFGGRARDGSVIFPLPDSGYAELEHLTNMIRVANEATEMVSQPYLENLHVSPAEAKFLRLGSLANYLGHQVYGYAQFRDQNSGFPLFLVYFDRACEVRGRVANGIETEWAVDIPGAGFYWLVARPLGGNASRFEMADTGVEPEFRYFLDDDRVLERRP